MADQKACPSNLVSSPLHSETERIPLSSSGALDPHWVPVPSPAFHESMVKLEKVAREDRDGDEENYKGCGLLRPRTKQRRLSDHQVQFLESSFDEENKLEPERKAQLARKLGLQSRQVAIWFQNRRARLKTKQLEKEYIELKNSYDKLKTEFDCLLKEKEQLKEEVLSLKDKLLIKGKEKQAQSSSVQLEPVSSVNISERQKSNTGIDKELPDWNPVSGHNQALLLEPANSSHAFEPDSSDFSQEEGDNLNFPMPEHGAYVASPASSSGFAFTAELEQELWSWPY